MRLSELTFLSERRNTLLFSGALTMVLSVLFLKEASFPPVLVLTAAAAFAVFLFAWSFKEPEAPLFLLAAVLPFNAQLGMRFEQMAGFPPVTFLGLFVFFMWARGFYSKDQTRWSWSSASLPLLLFAAWGLLGTLKDFYIGWEYVLVQLLGFFKGWLFCLALFLLFYNAAAKPGVLKTIVFIMASVSCLAALLAAYEYWSTGERVAGIFVQPNRLIDPPNQLAAFFNYMLFVPLAFFLMNASHPLGWLYLIPLLILLRGLMVTFSRGGYLAFVAGLYISALLRSRVLLILLIVAGAVILLHPEFLPQGVRWRLGQTVERRYSYTGGEKQAVKQLDRSSSDRVEIWKAAAEMIKENPVFGVGYGRFPSKVQNYWYAGIPFQPHNTYLAVPAELGIPALLFLGWLILIPAKDALMLYINGKDPFFRALGLGFIGGLASFLVSNTYISRTDYPHIMAYFWILAALVMRARKEANDAV